MGTAYFTCCVLTYTYTKYSYSVPIIHNLWGHLNLPVAQSHTYTKDSYSVPIIHNLWGQLNLPVDHSHIPIQKILMLFQ